MSDVQQLLIIEQSRTTEALRREADSMRLLQKEKRDLRKAKKRIRDLEIEKRKLCRK